MRFSSMLGLALAQSSILGSALAAGAKDVLNFDHSLSILGQARRRGYSSLGRSYSNRSKYRTHVGAKERARHAGKPDRLMHTPTANLRSNDFKRRLWATNPGRIQGDIADMKDALGGKPARKPRAKKAAAA